MEFCKEASGELTLVIGNNRSKGRVHEALGQYLFFRTSEG